MRVEIASEGEDSPEALEIPWESPDPAIRYFDLRSEPRALEQLPEARRHPPLRSFLAAVNSADSVFATARCCTRLDQDAPTAAGSCEFACSLDLVFAFDDLNFDRSHFDGLTRRLEELLSRDAPADALCVELRIRLCHFRASGRTGFALRIALAARGDAPEQAELRWSLGLVRLQQALLFLSRVIRHHLTPPG